MFKYALHKGRHDEWFVEELSFVGWGDSFANQFWNVRNEKFANLSEAEKSDAIQDFENRVREFFSEHTEFADLYLQRCRQARESGEWEFEVDFSPQMLATIWVRKMGDSCIAIKLAEIEVDEDVNEGQAL